ncbi:hypothetical protein [Ideonella sp.]|uniref:hypothetical protein n=2 Tax=Ideonella sp. TaxID=1929293 RepID=UPI00351B8398
MFRPKMSDARAQQGFVEAVSDRHASDWVDIDGPAEIVFGQDLPVDPAPVAAKTGAAGLDPATKADLVRLGLRWRERPGLVPVLQVAAKRSWPVWVPAAGLAGYGLWSDRPWLPALAIALAALPFAQAAWRHRRADRYQQLLKADALGRWSEMVGLAGQLRASGRFTSQLDFDLEVRVATLRARQGDLDGALEDLAPWRSQQSERAGSYEARVAGVHAAAGNRTGFVRLMGKAQAASGDEASRVLDHALAQARFGELAEAEALMARVDAAPVLPPQSEGKVLWTQGLIAMRRGSADAIHVLNQALAEFLRQSEQPAVWTALALCACDQAIALNAAGDRASARSILKRVAPVLRAQADRPLMALLKRDKLLSRREG